MEQYTRFLAETKSVLDPNYRVARHETFTPDPYSEALEAAFNRLRVSRNPVQDLFSNDLAGLPDLIGEDFGRNLCKNGIDNFGQPFGIQDFLDSYCYHRLDDSSVDFSDGSFPGFYQTRKFSNDPVLTRSGYFGVDYSSARLSQFYGLVSKNQNSVVKSNWNNNRRPHELHEPLFHFDFEELRGKIVTLAKDQYGCRYLQRTIGSITGEQLEMVFSEVIENVVELMMDHFGNYVVQKLLEVCSEEQMTQILLRLTKVEYVLATICLNVHGTRAVQKLLELISTPDQVSIVVSALSRGAVALTKDTNGHHVIQHCLKHFSSEDNKYLLNEVAVNCLFIATDKSGCCVLQQCVEHSRGELRNRLVNEIIANALLLAEHRYGNYVVQHILGLRVPEITANLLSQLEGSFTGLSCNKYGSNVVEKCLIESGEEQCTRIVMELLSSPNVSLLLVDPFGNYVIQSALARSKGIVNMVLQELIRMNIPLLRSNIYGKKVLAWFEKKKMLPM